LNLAETRYVYIYMYIYILYQAVIEYNIAGS
jgi:hypothetical protein